MKKIVETNKISFALLLIATILFATGCNTLNFAKQTGKGNKKMLYISHRGESHDAPENTMSAFRLSWERDTDGIELDIHLTADNQVICAHDSTTARMGDKDYKISKETYDILKTVDVGSKKNSKYKGEKMPLLSEVLAEAPAGRLVYIEIKTGPEILPALKKVIENSPARKEDLRIISFSNPSMREAKKLFPEIKMYTLKGVSWDKDKKRLKPTAKYLLALQKEMGIEGFDLQCCSKITQEYLDKLRKNNAEIIVWTIDDAEYAAKFKRLGVDGITSNRAEYLKKKLEN